MQKQYCVCYDSYKKSRQYDYIVYNGNLIAYRVYNEAFNNMKSAQ